MGKKSCAFQFTITKGNIFREYEMIEDTGLITLKQAQELWEKHSPRFIESLFNDNERPEMGIWINMKDPYDYHTCIPHVDNQTQYDGTRFYNNVKEYITL